MTSLRSGALVAAMAAVLAGSSCTDSVLCSDSDFNAAAGLVADFGNGTAEARVEAFLDATVELYAAVSDIETKLLAACTAIATDLGVPAADLQPQDPNVPGARVQKACNAASMAIRTTIQENVPAQVSLTVVVTPAQCGVDIDAYASCVAECEVDVSGSVEVTCEPGKLYGSCSGSCSGECRGTCSAGCKGSCGGTCTGSCSGSCYGTCSGTCSQKNAAGECIGTCSGTCTGTCSGTCTGGCDVACEGACEGSCTGECRGSCSVAFQEPRCDGEVDVQASAECEAACEADLSFDVQCSEPEVAVELAADVDAAAQAKLEALYATLEANFPVILEVSTAGSERLTVAVDAFVTSLDGASDALDAGAKAAACMLEAVAIVADLTARIDISVMATVEVSGSVSAQGSAQ